MQCHYQKSLRKAFVIHLVHQTNNICFIVLKIVIDAIFQVLPLFFFFALLKTTVVTFSKKQSLIGYIEVYEQNALIITKRKNLCLHRESTSKKTLIHSLIETVAKVSQQLAHVTGQSQLLHFENNVLRKIALLIIEEHEPGRKIQNI